jgi:hypothetical protein
MTEYHWSDSSALYQVKNGALADPRTKSAFSYLEDLTLHGYDTTGLARDLLDAIRELRDRELPADVPTGRSVPGHDAVPMHDHTHITMPDGPHAHMHPHGEEDHSHMHTHGPATMRVRGFTATGRPFDTDITRQAAVPGDTLFIGGTFHQVIVIDDDGTVHVGRGYYP